MQEAADTAAAEDAARVAREQAAWQANAECALVNYQKKIHAVPSHYPAVLQNARVCATCQQGKSSPRCLSVKAMPNILRKMVQS